MRHGVAVIYGIIFVAILSKILGKLSKENYNKIIVTAKIFEKNIGLLKNIQRSLEIEEALESFLSDKISTNNIFNFVLPINKGLCVYKNVLKNEVVDTLIIFKNLNL
ncbi:MAG: hypothetical protein AAB593_00170 [Patescibacteria group bacterium]